MKLFNFFRNSPERAAALQLYRRLVGQARDARFYRDLGVPDTIDGRFDMIAVHAFLVLHRLKTDHAESAKLAQELYDLMFADMDQNLREIGVGDLSVGKKIKKMTSVFHGRLVAYENALGDAARLSDALRRNLYRHTEPDAGDLETMSRYIHEQADFLATQKIEDLLNGEIRFATLTPEKDALGPTHQGK